MISVSAPKLNELIESLNNVADNLAQEIYISLSKAGMKTKSLIAKEVTSEIAVKQKLVRDNLSVKKDREQLTATVSLKKSARIGLRDFGAKQTKKGVSAKISKTKGRKIYKSAFMVQMFGNHVYHRPNNGRKIARLKGVSPWGVLAKNENRVAAIVVVSTEEVKAQITKRIRYLELKKAGGLNWQQDSEET